ncbi:MAG: hypothetical protein HRT67_05965 [Flavobacteriaceae bacterium]|nr:hypothetical protein [Flavobacteriaceae bacterium]
MAGLNPDVSQINNQEFDAAFNPKPQKGIDTFSISDIARDPFLGTLASLKKVSNTNTTLNTIPDVMPDISYGGLIQKKGSKSKVYVVNINNQQYLLKQGQSVNDVKLLKGDKTAIIIRFKRRNYTVKL